MNIAINVCPPPLQDGYLRLTGKDMYAMQMVHVTSELVPALLCELRESVCAVLAGYTEWEAFLHARRACVTIGWDWYLTSSGSFYVAYDDVRSNVMLVDISGKDTGPRKTIDALLDKLAALNWPTALLRKGIHVSTVVH
jgi:hypothetical protein